MIFSEIIIISQYWGDSYHSDIESDIKSQQKEIFSKLDKRIFLDIADSNRINEKQVRCRLLKISNTRDNISKILNVLSSIFLDYTFQFVSQAEITSKTFMSGIKHYGRNIDESLNEMGINTTLNLPYHESYWNELLVQKEDKPSLSSSSYLYGQPFQEEIKRIQKHPQSNPLAKKIIHYVFETGENLEAMEVLVSNLLAANRLQSGRMTVFEIKGSPSGLSGLNNLSSYLESLCVLGKGGTVLVKFPEQIAQGDIFFGDSNELLLTKMAALFQIYRDDVQFIFSIPKENFESILSEYFPNDQFIQFRSVALTRGEAECYFVAKAHEDEIGAIETLLSLLSEEQTIYSGQQLHQMYHDWYFLKAVKNFYPEYQKLFEVRMPNEKVSSTQSAYEMLQSLIGLSETKKTILQSINLLKLQRLRKEQGLESEAPNRHMVFTGNPGTGKTTVARLIAEILREEKILSKGLLIDGSRSNLVARYVGQTAPLVKEAFKRAKDSVLFIDEAYSFVDDMGGYGSEAIATIVEEMENHREDTVVIFAGYKEPMERFIHSNEGLRSRIGFTIDFPDYNTDELMQIMDLCLKWKNYRITPKTHEFLEKFFKAIKMDKTSGNARLVRNLIEKAEFKMSNRLISKNPNEKNIKTLMTMKKEDFLEETERLLSTPSSLKQIGFKKD